MLTNLLNKVLSLGAMVAVAGGLIFGAADANASQGAWSCEKVYYNTSQGSAGTNPSTVKSDFFYRHTFDNASISSTNVSAVLGAGVADSGCGGHVIDINSELFHTSSAAGGASGGAAGVGITITTSRDLSATGVFPTTVSQTAATGTVSNTYISGTLPGANMVQVTVSNSAVGNANHVRVVIDEKPNK